MLAEAQRLAVRTLTLHVGDRLFVQLRREAGATFYSGDFNLFDGLVLRRLEDAAARRLELLRDRARKHDGAVPPAISVRTRASTFATADAVSELLHALERKPSTGVAIFHRRSTPVSVIGHLGDFGMSGAPVVASRREAQPTPQSGNGVRLPPGSRP